MRIQIPYHYLFFLLGIIMVSSCGVTKIDVDSSNNQSFSVYVNGENKGQAPAKITKRGFPQKSYVEVKDADNRQVTSMVIKRKFVFNFYTFLDLFYPYLLLTNFEYKKTYLIPIPKHYNGSVSPWDSNAKSSWD